MPKPEPQESSVPAPPKYFRISKSLRPSLKTRLTPEIIAELDALWHADPRVPTLQSRQAWALARSIEPIRVHNWFSHKKSLAERKGQIILEGTYELDTRPPTELEKITGDDGEQENRPKKRTKRPESRSSTLSPPAGTKTKAIDEFPSSELTLVDYDSDSGDHTAFGQPLCNSGRYNSKNGERARDSGYLLSSGRPMDANTPSKRAYTPLAGDCSGSALSAKSRAQSPRATQIDSDSQCAATPQLETRLCKQGTVGSSTFTCVLCKPGPTNKEPTNLPSLLSPSDDTGPPCLYKPFSLLLSRYGESFMGIRMKLVDEVAVGMSAIPWLESLERGTQPETSTSISTPLLGDLSEEVVPDIPRQLAAKLEAINRELELM